MILEAASNVDYLPYRAEFQVNFPHGVWRSLVLRGLLYRIKKGWKITPEGRTITKHVQPKEPRMERRKGKLRYNVERQANGMWAVIDQHVSKIKMHNDVIDTFPAREAARVRCRELNDGDEHGTKTFRATA